MGISLVIEIMDGLMRAGSDLLKVQCFIHLNLLPLHGFPQVLHDVAKLLPVYPPYAALGIRGENVSILNNLQSRTL